MESIKFSAPYFGEEEAIAAADVVRSQWVVGGSKLETLENRFAEISGAPYGIGVSSWTTGAFLVLKALGIGPGDEVIVPSLTFIASVNVIVHAGATPVFADIDPCTWNIDPIDVERKMTSRTKAILPVDQIGVPCDMDAINEIAARHHLVVIQDAACSFASRNQNRPMGSLCDITIFSLHARKIVTTGEGGMIVTKDKVLKDRLKRLRHQGMSLSDFERRDALPTHFESYPEVGYNFRITDIQAAIGLQQLNRLDDILKKRSIIAERYQSYFLNHPWFTCQVISEGYKTNWQSYQIRVNQASPFTRNQLMDILFNQGIPTRRGVMASHLEKPYQSFSAKLPITEMIAASTFQLPMHPALTKNQQDYILQTFDAITQSQKSVVL
jgi:perosamine synthetase